MRRTGRAPAVALAVAFAVFCPNGRPYWVDGLEGPPPGCQCTMERCCGGPARCSYLSWLDDDAREKVCEPFLTGKADKAMGVCDAVLQYVSSSGEALEPGKKHHSFHIFADGKHTCDDFDLIEDDCQAPYTQDGGIDHSVFNSRLYDGGRCQLTSVDPHKGTVVLTSFGCQGSDGELAIYPDVLPEEFSSVGVCPMEPTLQFSMNNTNGIANKRWMCQDVPAREGSAALMGLPPGQQSAPITSVRFMFVSLGDLPCGMPLIGGEYYHSGAAMKSPDSSGAMDLRPNRNLFATWGAAALTGGVAILLTIL